MVVELKIIIKCCSICWLIFIKNQEREKVEKEKRENKALPIVIHVDNNSRNIIFYQGILDNTSIQTMSHLCMNVFIPCLVLGKMGSSLSPTLLKETWMLAVWAVVDIIIAVCVAIPLRMIIRPPDFLYKEVLLGLVFQNVVALPMVLAETLTSNGALAKHDGAFDRAIMYIFSFQIGFNSVFWSFSAYYLNSTNEVFFFLVIFFFSIEV